MNRKMHLIFLVLAPLLVLLFGGTWAERAQAERVLQTEATPTPSDEGLFTDAHLVSAQVAASPSVSRTRYVRVRFEQLGLSQLGESAGALPATASHRVLLNLFDDTILVALLDQVVHNETGSNSWIGHLEGIEYSFVILTVRDGLLVGNIIYPGGVYEIYRVSEGIHVIAEVDQSLLPEDSLLPTAGSVAAESAALPAAPMTDDGSTVDVLVVYTDDASQRVGGIDQMEEFINNAVNTSNQTYINSQITLRLRLAASALVTYTETHVAATEVGNLQAGSGVLTIAHKLRNAYAADLVLMTVEDLGGTTAGRAFDIMSVVTTSFAISGFVVVQRDQAVNNLSFPHELGHLMGARHDWYVDDTKNSPYTYNHGYVLTPTLTNPWRTVMAYNNECDDRGRSCTRIPYWSNPNILNGAYRMGVPGGTSTSCTAGNLSNPECDADNHRTLNNTDYTVANFVPGNLANVYVDTTCTLVGGKCVETGSSSYPYDTFTEGVFRVAPNGNVFINTGTFPETLVLVNKTPRGLTINRPMTLTAVGGVATIGQ